MNSILYQLMESGGLPPLSYYFARFVAEGCEEDEHGLLAHSAALVSLRNLHGDVCVDLAQYAHGPLFETGDRTDIPVPRGPSLQAWIAALQKARRAAGPEDATAPLILDGQRLYLGKYWHFEQSVACALLDRLGDITVSDPSRLRAGLEKLFPHHDGDPVDWQRVAAAIAASRRFAVISGGPGTGKTTTVVKLLALLLEQTPDMHIALAAPTGKAATRLSDAIRGGKAKLPDDVEARDRIPEEASTIHRLLGYGPGHGFRYNRDNPLVVDCLVVDEASMVDLSLMARLLGALPEQARIILLGDRNQLASVEAGSVLGDITGHGREIRYSSKQIEFLEGVGAAPADELPVADDAPPIVDAVGLLRVSYRYSAASGIGKLARKVNEGEGEEALAILTGGQSDDTVWPAATEDRLLAACVEWAAKNYASYLRKNDVGEALAEFEKSRVLAALRLGPLGVETLNARIEARLQEIGTIRGGIEYPGKPIMITMNDYEVSLFNGDIGLLWPDEGGTLKAWFTQDGDTLRGIPVRQLPAHTCAYALTVHKSQGSEFDEVLVVLPFEDSPIVTRELIYTAVTRARKKVTLHGSEQTFVKGCQRRVQRTSALAERLGWDERGGAG